MNRWVEISFDCLPLRCIPRLDVPMDASPKYQERCRRIKEAMDKHGSHNAYFLYNAQCVYHLLNDEANGLLTFKFEGTLLTDDQDLHAVSADFAVDLASETCDWITEPIVDWFKESVTRAVLAEFDRFIAAGDLDKAKDRIAEIQAASDDAEGYLGMYL